MIFRPLSKEKGIYEGGQDAFQIKKRELLPLVGSEKAKKIFCFVKGLLNNIKETFLHSPTKVVLSILQR